MLPINSAGGVFSSLVDSDAKRFWIVAEMASSTNWTSMFSLYLVVSSGIDFHSLMTCLAILRMLLSISSSSSLTIFSNSDA